MRAKKFLLITAWIVLFVAVGIFANGFLVPALRCNRARQLSASEHDRSAYDRIVEAAYPSFDPSIYDLKDVSYDEKGYVYFEYVRNREHLMPIPTDGFDGDDDFLDIFRYDPLWNHVACISKSIPN